MSKSILPIHAATGLRALGLRRNGQPIWPVLGGDGTHDPSDDDPDDDKPDDDADDSDDDDPEGADQLGDKGKKALDAMKAKNKEERQKRRDAEAEVEKLRTAAAKDGDKPDLESIRREAEKSATQKANARIVRSEIRAAAAGKLSDPKDALTFLDLDQFEVDEHGEVDSEEVSDAIDDLLERKPYLSAATAKRFHGTGDGGAAARKAGKGQLSKSDLDGMTSEQINKARSEGRLDRLMGKKA